MHNKVTILVTGSTDGLGRRIVERLAGQGTHLLLHGRDAERGRAVGAAIEAAGGRSTFFAGDFSSLKVVDALADAILGHTSHLDILVNNAGYADFSGPRRLSQDGYELNLAVNYLAQFLLTRRLLSVLGVGRPSRIINVAAAGQTAIDFDDLMLERRYDGRRACAQSKLADVMHAFDLADTFDPAWITANALHPATFMDTGMVRANALRAVNSVEPGADAVLALVGRDDLAGRSGLYFDGRREARADGQAYDPDARRRLRVASIRLVETALGRPLPPLSTRHLKEQSHAG